MIGANPNVAKTALRSLSSFASTYLCKSASQQCFSIKLPSKIAMNWRMTVRCVLLETYPHTDKLLKSEHY